MGIRQGEMRWPKDQPWLWRWSRLSFRHSVPPLRAARAPAVHRPASERRPVPRDLGYEAMGGPSSPGQRRILLQPEAPISPHPKRIRYRHQMRFRRTRGATRISRVLKCSLAEPPNLCVIEYRPDAILPSRRRRLKPFYSTIGRPSVAPELMIRMLVIGY